MELEILLKMILAAVLGGVIGIQRQLSYKEAGLMANMLISLSCALMTTLAIYISGNSKPQAFAHSATIGHIFSALGLLGAGIIVKERLIIRGIGGAITILISGSIGIAVGSGFYLSAFMITIFILIGYLLLKRISPLLEQQGKTHTYVIATEENASTIIEIKKIIIDLGIHHINSSLRKSQDGYEIDIIVSTSQNKNKVLIDRMMQIPTVKEISSETL